MISLTVNGKKYDVDVSSDMPLLWVIRDAIGLTGTKFGCGLTAMWRVYGASRRHARTFVRRGRLERRDQESHDNRRTLRCIESSLADRLDCRTSSPMRLLPVRPDHVGRCPARTRTAKPTDAQIDAAMSGNICRCGTYQRIRRAIHRAARG